MRVGLAATMAEYFRDVTKQDVLLFIDNIFRFVKLVLRYQHYWVGCLSGRIPTLATEMGDLHHSTTEGSITSIQAVYVPADDLTDPAPATTFAHGCYSAVSRFGI